VSKNKGKKNGGSAGTQAVVDEPPKDNIQIPTSAAAKPVTPNGQPEIKELTDGERLRSQNFAAQQALIKEQEQNIALQERNVQLQSENLKLRKELLDRAKKETEGERADWLRGMGVVNGDNVALRDGKLIIQRGETK
jgi:hypothetical protein